jgi:hypothetical protein
MQASSWCRACWQHTAMTSEAARSSPLTGCQPSRDRPLSQRRRRRRCTVCCFCRSIGDVDKRSSIVHVTWQDNWTCSGNDDEGGRGEWGRGVSCRIGGLRWMAGRWKLDWMEDGAEWRWRTAVVDSGWRSAGLWCLLLFFSGLSGLSDLWMVRLAVFGSSGLSNPFWPACFCLLMAGCCCSSRSPCLVTAAFWQREIISCGR